MEVSQVGEDEKAIQGDQVQTVLSCGGTDGPLGWRGGSRD